MIVVVVFVLASGLWWLRKLRLLQGRWFPPRMGGGVFGSRRRQWFPPRTGGGGSGSRSCQWFLPRMGAGVFRLRREAAIWLEKALVFPSRMEAGEIREGKKAGIRYGTGGFVLNVSRGRASSVKRPSGRSIYRVAGRATIVMVIVRWLMLAEAVFLYVSAPLTCTPSVPIYLTWICPNTDASILV